MFNGCGHLVYYTTWLIIKVEEDVCRYYRNLIYSYSRVLRLNPSKYGAHITVIAGKYELIDEEHRKFWNKYQDELVNFKYNPNIQNDSEYFWMEVKCPRIEEIREELGLPRKIIHPWHLTVGNII